MPVGKPDDGPKGIGIRAGSIPVPDRIGLERRIMSANQSRPKQTMLATMNQPETSAGPISEESAAAGPDPGPDAPGAPEPAEGPRRERAERPGKPFPLGPTWDGPPESISPYTRRRPNGSSSAFSTMRGRRRSRGGSGCASAPMASGMATSPASGRDSSTAIGCTDRTDRPKDSGSTPTSCCSIPTRKRSGGSCAGRTNCSATRSGTRTRICPSIRGTAPPTRRWPRSSTGPSTGAKTGDRTSAWSETIIYEAHVRGLTRRHPGVPPAHRGTYAGMAAEPILDHLRKLGVTTIELMPVHHFVQDRHLVDRGLRNYWGYNTLAFFAPEPGYGASRGPASCSASSRRWCGVSMRRASKWCSTSCTTTRPKAITPGRRSRSAASTIWPTTARCPATRGTTWITRAAATP